MSSGRRVFFSWTTDGGWSMGITTKRTSVRRCGSGQMRNIPYLILLRTHDGAAYWRFFQGTARQEGVSQVTAREEGVTQPVTAWQKGVPYRETRLTDRQTASREKPYHCSDRMI